MMWTLAAVCVFLTLLWYRWRHKNRRLLEMAKHFPGPPTLPLLGNAHKFMCQPEELIIVIQDLIKNYGDVVKFWLGPDLNIVVSNPDDIKVLLTSTKTIYKGPQYKYMADVLGGGILSGSGTLWRKHRKIATPNYGKKAIESYSDIFNKEVDILLQKYRDVPRGKQIDIYHEIVRTTSYAVCQTLMGLTREETMSLPHLQRLIDTSPVMYDIVFDRMTKWYLQLDPVFWLTKSYTNLKDFILMIDEFSAEIIRKRRIRLETFDQSKLDLMNSDEDSLKNTQLSVIDRFLLSEELDHHELLKETFTVFTSVESRGLSENIIIFASHDGVSSQLSDVPRIFTTITLPDKKANIHARHISEKLYKEIISVMGDDDRPVTDEDLRRMPYLEMAFKEVLRLFPIGAMLQRTVVEDITISSGTLPAGSSLVIPIYYIQRDSRFWTNPEEFDPERFTPENTRLRKPYSYIPFSLGPMDCLGRYFGTKLIKTICVRVLREFKLTSLETYKDLRVIIAISVASRNGFPAILTPRKEAIKTGKVNMK